MYDTSAGLTLVAPRLKLAERPCWQFERVSKKRATERGPAQVSTRLFLNTRTGLHLELIDGCTLKAERSLPGVLHGSNVVELRHDELPDACARVDREVAEQLRADLPPFAEWQAHRVDYCENAHLGDELAVRRELREAREVHLARIGRPMMGDSGTSLAWATKNQRVKLYSPFARYGDPRSEGVLRAEVMVRSLGSFRKLLDRGKGEPVQLLEVLTPDVRAEVMARFSDVFARKVPTMAELTNVRFAREFIDYFKSPGRALTLAGFCWAWRLAGAPSARDISRGKRVFGFSRSATYKYFADLRAFRLHLVEHGLERLGVTDEASNPHEVGMVELRDALASDEGFAMYLAELQARSEAVAA